MKIIYKKKILSLVVVLFLIAFTFSLIFFSSINRNTIVENDKTKEYTFENDEKWNGDLNNQFVNTDEYIEMPGYVEFTVNELNKTIPLVNPEGNSVYMKFTLSVDKKEIYKTDLIKPGNKTDVEVFDLVQQGESQITMLIETFDMQSMQECNSLEMIYSIRKV